MSDKLANPESKGGLTRGVISFTLGSICILLTLDPVILGRVIPRELWPWVDKFWPWLMALLPALGLFFGAIGIMSRGKYLAIIGMTVCFIALVTLLYPLFAW
jgi:hypothetical protein